jgi:hypothetical protein
MSEPITSLGLMVGFIIGIMLVFPFIFVFFERVYGPFCEWVWDLFGV